MFCQVRTRFINNHFRGIRTQSLLDNRDSNKIKMMSESLIHFKKKSIPFI